MDPRTRPVFRWLVLCAALVVAMVAVGGITRLTRSGLSIVEWNPVSGVLPPLSAAAWEEAFAAYRLSPEGRLINSELDLSGFQRIFLVEWFHRLLGRSVGAVFLLPWLFFVLRRRLTRAQATRYFVWFGLGGLQGVVGWLMVRSGLFDTPHVSPYWLTGHLLMALLVFVALEWEALLLAAGPTGLPVSRSSRWPLMLFAPILVLALAWGGLMAGHKAGWLSATFPLMAGEWFPAQLWMGEGPSGLLSQGFLVHYTHRVLGVSVALAAVGVFAAARRAERFERRAGAAVLGLALLQVTLGALTVWFGVPVAVAVLHQVNGALLLGATVALAFAQRGPRAAQETAALRSGAHDAGQSLPSWPGPAR